MPRKCAPGVICIENMTLFVLLAIFVLLATIYYNQYTNQRQPKRQRTKTLVVQQPNSLASVATRGDTFNDPYAPPLKNDGLYFRGDSSDIRGVPPPIQVPVNIETRGVTSSYSQVGILTNSGPENLILPLMGRRHMTGRDKWQYYTISNTGMVNTKLPVSVKGKSCTSEYGCDSIMNGDQIYVEGYNSTFNATIYENGTFSYIPQL
jgi:hypothetical protein